MNDICPSCGGTDGTHTYIGCPNDELPTSPPTSSATSMPATPECDRQAEIHATGEPLVLTNFVDWLTTHGYTVARLCTHPRQQTGRRCWDCGDSGMSDMVSDYGKLFAEYFEIDLAKVETERRAILDALRERS